MLWYGAANRDPDIFPEPNVFDIERENAGKHVAFGHGVHKCLGSRIAQMQLTLAFERILIAFLKSLGRANKRYRRMHWFMRFLVCVLIFMGQAERGRSLFL